MINRKIKIYKAFHAYGTYLDKFYIKYMCSNDSFENQLIAFENDCFPWILSWHQFNHQDNIEIFETIHNASFLQKQWAKDNEVQYDDSNWQTSIVIKQIEKFQPDVCVLYPPAIFDQKIISEIRGIVNHDIIIGGYDGMDRKNIELYSGYDFVITCSDYISSFYRNKNILSYSLEFAFDPKINSLIKGHNNLYPISFCGSLFPNVHKNRYNLISYLVWHTPIIISSDFELNTKYKLFSKKNIRSIIIRDKSYFDSYKIHCRNIGSLYGIDMYQFLKDSAITINSHGDNINFAANVRLYEATGIGTCLLTDWKENLAEIFEPEVECLTYKTKEEAADKIKYYMKHENERKKIALRGQEKTLTEYTYTKRIDGVLNFIRGLL